MDSIQNPFGLHTVTPYLVVEDVESLIDFLVEIFAAKLRGEIKYREDQSVQHAEVTIGDSVIMLGEPNESTDAMPSMLYVYVKNCDQTFDCAVEAGAKPVLPPQNYPHGDRYGGFKDASGNTWWVVTHIGDD